MTSEPEPSTSLPAAHGPLNVALAAVLGSPLSGALMMLSNEVFLGAPQASRGLVLVTLVASVALSLTAVWFPGQAAVWIGLNLLGAFVLWRLSSSRHRELLERHPQRQPVFLALAQGGFALAILLGGAHTVHMFLVDTSVGRVNARGEQYVHYRDGANVMDARALSDFLMQTPFPGDEYPFFNGDHPVDVRVTRDRGAMVVSFVLAKDAWDNPVTQAGYQALGEMLALRVFPNRRLQVRLCDGGWATIHTLNIR